MSLTTASYGSWKSPITSALLTSSGIGFSELHFSDGNLYWLLQAGQYTYTADHRPLLGASEVPGLALNCGYSGHGIMASAGGSRIAVDSLLGRLRPEENPFRPQREMLERPLDIL